MNSKYDDDEQAAYLREWREKPKGGCSFLWALALVLAAVGVWL